MSILPLLVLFLLFLNEVSLCLLHLISLLLGVWFSFCLMQALTRSSSTLLMSPEPITEDSAQGASGGVTPTPEELHEGVCVSE